jgi:hypothetical protein
MHILTVTTGKAEPGHGKQRYQLWGQMVMTAARVSSKKKSTLHVIHLRGSSPLVDKFVVWYLTVEFKNQHGTFSNLQAQERCYAKLQPQISIYRIFKRTC